MSQGVGSLSSSCFVRAGNQLHVLPDNLFSGMGRLADFGASGNMLAQVSQAWANGNSKVLRAAAGISPASGISWVTRVVVHHSKTMVLVMNSRVMCAVGAAEHCVHRGALPAGALQPGISHCPDQAVTQWQPPHLPASPHRWVRCDLLSVGPSTPMHSQTGIEQHVR
jgi:hypothetical protein